MPLLRVRMCFDKGLARLSVGDDCKKMEKNFVDWKKGCTFAAAFDKRKCSYV